MPGSMTLSDNGAAFIQSQEGLRLTPYQDAAGISIGYGHHFQSGEAIPPSITQEQASAYFQEDIQTAVDAINSLVTVPLNQNQFDALVDFVYNEGTGHFRSSILLRDLNAGNYQAAAGQLSQWNLSGGTVNSALANRRTAELQLFTSVA